ncbi:MAG: DUF2231 domain-containing protein [Actinomycetales bacterium]
MNLPLDTVFGLPVHVLVVHAVVVLLPLASIGAVLLALLPRFSQRFAVLVVVLAWAAVPAAFLAEGSGEQFAERVGLPQPHAELGESMPYFAVALAVVLLVFWLFDRGIPGNRGRPWWLKGLAVVLILVAVLTTWWTIRVGHSGAEATWSAVVQNTTG